MSPDAHDPVHAYAVGALSPEEAADFAAHLETCPTCRSEVAALSAVTTALSDSVAADPPPTLRAAVLAEVARTPQDSVSAAGSPAAHRPTHRAPSGPPEEPSSAVVPLRRRSATTWATSLVAAAAVLAAAAFGGLWWQERQDADDATATADQLTAVLTADDVRTVSGVSAGSDHNGTIVMSRDQDAAYFVASDLPDLPDDQVYEAWTIKGSEAPAPAGTLTPSSTPTTLALPAASFQADQMAITVEPEGGSDVPTSDPVLTFTMPAG